MQLVKYIDRSNRDIPPPPLSIKTKKEKYFSPLTPLLGVNHATYQFNEKS